MPYVSISLTNQGEYRERLANIQKPRKSILKPIPKVGGNNENVEGNEEEGQETLVHEPSIMVPAADVTLVQGQGRSRQSIISQALEQERMDGYTVNFNSSGRPSISNRRVSFAPSAHVRFVVSSTLYGES